MRALIAALLALGTAAASADAAAAATRYESEFTPLAPCRALGDGPDGRVSECPGRDGVRVLLAEQETRRWLRLRVARDETDLMLAITGRATPGVSPTLATTRLEWRYRVEGTQRTLVALILAVVDAPGTSGRMALHLLVLRVTPDVTFCVVSPAATSDAARALADGPTPCHWIIPPRETS
jgi:hypothetical protein